MNSALLVVAIVVAVVLAAVIAVQRVKYKNLVQQTQKSMDDLQAKEAIMQKEAMIKAKEALHNEREQLNEDERERRREFAQIDIHKNKPPAIMPAAFSCGDMCRRRGSPSSCA